MTQSAFHVERELYIPAPDGLAVYAQNPCYASVTGTALVESVKHEALHFAPEGHRLYYHPRMFRRFSPDNGRTWTAGPDQGIERPDATGPRRNVSVHGLDVRRNALVSVHCTYELDPREDMFKPGNRRRRTMRMWYELSFDAGRTWTPAKPVIDERPGFDEVHWGPGLTFGESGAQTDISQPVFLGDGRIVYGLTLLNAGPDGRYGVIYMRGRWNAAGTDLLWTFGAPVILEPGQSPAGCCEPAPAALGGLRLFNVMRCQGDEKRGIPSTRYATCSEDGGDTWSKPEPLAYEDGQTVWSPASLSSFFHSSRTDRWYWLGNILPGPVYHQMPRYPLCLAEFDPQRRCLIRDSVRVIQDHPANMPKEVRYTNWGYYEERGSGDLIMTLPEQPKLMDFSAMTKAEHYTADCYRYRIRV